MMELDKIICGDNVTVLRGLPEACVDLTVTSPPYDNLRTYKGYTWDFESLARELYRVTKPGGVVVWVVGDATIDGSETGTSFRQALYFMGVGFNLHDTMIYQKLNPMPGQMPRYQQEFEYMFVFSKGMPAVFNSLKERSAQIGRKQNGNYREINGGMKQRFHKNFLTQKQKKRGNVWGYFCGAAHNTTDDVYEHPATFPEALARDHILSWSNPGDIVLDPFVGSGTTCKMAKETGRHWLGIDISDEYCKIAEKRVRGANVPLFT